MNETLKQLKKAEGEGSKEAAKAIAGNSKNFNGEEEEDKAIAAAKSKKP